MRILYAIQGTGNGHITVAREVIPILQKRAEVDILISGTEVDVDLPFEIKYRFKGLCFVFGKKGGIDYLETFKKIRIKQLFNDIKNLPVDEYDLIFSDFEPVSAWACKLRNKICIGFSHQAAVTRKLSPKPANKDYLGLSVLKYYAPVDHYHGFHYLPYDKNISTPIIRKQIREFKTKNEGHYTVYLPAFSDKKIIKVLALFPDTKWKVFSKKSKNAYVLGNISVQPIDNDSFVDCLGSSEGVLCGSGFQTPAEVMFLKKKLMVIPMKGQYEQQCNGAALKLLGVPVLKKLKKNQAIHINEWLKSEKKVSMDYTDDTEYILNEIITEHYPALEKATGLKIESPSRFRNLILKKIFYQS